MQINIKPSDVHYIAEFLMEDTDAKQMRRSITLARGLLRQVRRHEHEMAVLLKASRQKEREENKGVYDGRKEDE